MLLTCPNCETIFRVDSHKFKPEGQAVRCSVCSHVWQAKVGKDTMGKEPNDVQEAFKALRLPLAILLVFLGLAAGVAFNRGVITAYFPSLIGVFDVAGLTIRPVLTGLEVTDLEASYIGDNLRLSGNLLNNRMVRSHAPDLRVTVTATDGVIMNEVIIKTEAQLIDPGEKTSFFIQLDVESSGEANITVAPLANRIYQ